MYALGRALVAAALASACAGLAPGCSGPPVSDELPTAPEEWRTVDFDGLFTFSVPPGMTRTEGQPVDSRFRVYEGPECSLTVDHGRFSDPLEYADRPGFRERALEIQGRRARYVTFEDAGEDGQAPARVAAVHFPDLEGDLKLTLYARCRGGDAARERARTIVLSVRFPGE